MKDIEFHQLPLLVMIPIVIFWVLLGLTILWFVIEGIVATALGTGPI